MDNRDIPPPTDEERAGYRQTIGVLAVIIVAIIGIIIFAANMRTPTSSSTVVKQTTVQTGLLKNTNGMGLFTQNQVFNALDVLLSTLEEEYGFDSSKLLSTSALKLVRKRVDELCNKDEQDIVDDFLSGILITEMVQHLRVTQANSVRSLLPKRFTNPFEVTYNNAKAIAHAFNLKNKIGISILVDDSTDPFSNDANLLDVKINGRLINPDFNNPKNAAGILSTAILVAEQMILEQLLRDACEFGDEHIHAQNLQTILGGMKFYYQLIELAKKAPRNEQGPILGLQFAHCDEIVALLRKLLWIGSPNLIDVVNMLRSNEFSANKFENALHINLEKLFNIGAILQDLEATSVRNQGSRGINAGVTVVIKTLNPRLYKQLEENGRIEKSQDNTKSFQHAHPIEGDVCPFFRTNKPKKQNTWCRYFTKRIVPIVLTTTALATSITIAKIVL